MANYPMHFLEHTDAIPSMIALMTLMPFMYFNIFQILSNQHKLLTVKMKNDIFELEKSHITEVIKANSSVEERLRIERHDLRHRMNSILVMLENGETDEAIEYIKSSTKAFDASKVERYCQNSILNAVFTSYYSKALKSKIKISSQLAIPNELPVDDAELSIVIANALENAINACKKLPEDERVINCRYKILGKKHMLQISNPYKGRVHFDTKGHPYSHKAEHGIGTLSTITFCEKYSAQLDYKAENGWFYMRIVL